MGIFEAMLEKLGVFQKKHTITLFIIIVLITIFMIIGVFKVQLETDMNKEMPQELPIYQLNNKITDKFGGQDMVFLVITLDDSASFNSDIDDIRDPAVISYLSRLEKELKKDTKISKVISAGSYLGTRFSSTDQVISFLKSYPQLNAFFSRDYKTTTMLVYADIGSDEDKLISLTNSVKEKIYGLSPPSGIKVMITGVPPMRSAIMDILAHDAIYTISLASIIILLLLIITEKSISKGLLVFLPLAIGLIWTMGTMGWIGLKLSIATVGLGAMILGLGVEYGVFMYSRYREERDKGFDQLDSLKVSLPAVGIAILGSSLTTIVGFLALTLSFFPMLQHLGQSLALGIFYCLVAALFVAPIIYLLEENFEIWYTDRLYNSMSKKKGRRMAK